MHRRLQPLLRCAGMLASELRRPPAPVSRSRGSPRAEAAEAAAPGGGVPAAMAALRRRSRSGREFVAVLDDGADAPAPTALFKPVRRAAAGQWVEVGVQVGGEGCEGVGGEEALTYTKVVALPRPALVELAPFEGYALWPARPPSPPPLTAGAQLRAAAILRAAGGADGAAVLDAGARGVLAPLQLVPAPCARYACAHVHAPPALTSVAPAPRPARLHRVNDGLSRSGVLRCQGVPNHEIDERDMQGSTASLPHSATAASLSRPPLPDIAVRLRCVRRPRAPRTHARSPHPRRSRPA